MGCFGQLALRETFMQSEIGDVRAAAYRDYAAWKGWDGKRDTFAAAEIFKIEMGRAGISPPAKILEVGFGNGDFLRWGRGAGYDVSGIEINESFVECARNNGFKVWQGDVSMFDEAETGMFDAIVAFDVLEHLTKAEIIAHLKAFHRLLKPEGVTVFRFPNAASPFGLWAQTGDITHETVLSGTSMVQLGSLTGFAVAFAGNSARSVWAGKRRRPMSKRIAYIIRNTFEIFLGYLYVGQRIPLDVCMTVVMRRI